MAGSSMMSKTLGSAGFLFGNVLMPGMTFVESRKEGRGIVSSLTRTAASEIFYSTPIGAAYGMGQIAKMGAQVGFDYGRRNADRQRRYYKSQFGGNFNLSENGHTMRQRGMNAIQRSGMNVQNAFGSEARSYHRGYFSE